MVADWRLFVVPEVRLLPRLGFGYRLVGAVMRRHPGGVFEGILTRVVSREGRSTEGEKSNHGTQHQSTQSHIVCLVSRQGQSTTETVQENATLVTSTLIQMRETHSWLVGDRFLSTAGPNA
jgi:hypothetical protein